MSQFEYLAIAVSLVLSLAAIRLANGFSHALDSNRRYPIHAGLVSIHLLATVNLFWMFWEIRDIEWTYPRFLLALVGPGLLYVGACSLVPETPGSVESWRAYYFTNRRRYFATMCLWVVATLASDSVFYGLPILDPKPIRLVLVGYLAAALLGLSSEQPRVQAGVVLSIASVTVFALLLLVLSRP